MKVALAIASVVVVSHTFSLARDLIINGSFEEPTMAPATIQTYSEGATNIGGWVVLHSNGSAGGYASRMSTGYKVYQNDPEAVWTPFGSTVFDTDNFVYRGNAIAEFLDDTWRDLPGCVLGLARVVAIARVVSDEGCRVGGERVVRHERL